MHRRQALIKLLLVLLFAVACLNFFIAIDYHIGGGGVSIVMPTEKSVLAKTSKSSLNTVADVITIEAGHLNGSLYLPDALQPIIISSTIDCAPTLQQRIRMMRIHVV
jgi:hypothetical protein